jgi:hypothetical protein
MVEAGKRCKGKFKLQLQTMEVGRKKNSMCLCIVGSGALGNGKNSSKGKERGEKNAIGLTLGLTYFELGAHYNLIGPKFGQSKYNVAF